MSNTKKHPDFNASKEYQKTLEYAAQKKLRDVIRNSTFEHIVQLTYLLIKNAKKEIKIFTSPSDLIYEDARIKKAMKRAIKRGVKIKILLLKKRSSENKLFFSNALVKYKILGKGSKLRNFFFISDKTGFRIEEKHGPYHEKELYLIESIISFNSPWACEPLHKIFNFYFNPKSKS